MRTIEEAKSYFQTLAKEAGLDDAATNAVLGTLGNEKFAKGVLDGMARHDEMSSAMDRARNEVTAAQARKAELDDWYSKVAQPAVVEAQKVRGDLDKYRSTYGDLTAGPTNDTPRNDRGQFASPKDVEAIGNTTVQIAKVLSWAQADHVHRFGEVFDPDDFEKFAVSRGLPPKQAYQEFIAPKVADQARVAAAKKDEEHAAALKAAREEGVREGMTRKQWNGETTRTTDVYGRDKEALKKEPEAAEDDAKSAFLNAWNEFETSGAASH